MNTEDIIKIINDAINTNSPKFENFLNRIEFLIRENNKINWYQEGWVIALIASLSTALLLAITESLVYFYRKNKIKKNIAYDLYNEIISNILQIKKFKDSNHALVDDFKQKAIASDFSEGHPSLFGIKYGKNDCYKMHLSNLFLLKNKNDLLVLNIKLFYDMASDYDGNSKIIGESFGKYYEKNPMVGYMDIVNREDGQYKDANLVILKGYDIASKLQLKFKTDVVRTSRKEKISNIRKISKLEVSIISNIQEEADRLNIDIMSLLLIIHKYGLYKNTINTGEYERTRDSLFKHVKIVFGLYFNRY